MQRARQRDVIDIVPCARSERALLSPTRHAPIDELRIARQQHVRPESESLHHAWTKAFDHGVRFVREEECRCDAVTMFEIERHGTTATKHHVVPPFTAESQTRILDAID